MNESSKTDSAAINEKRLKIEETLLNDRESHKLTTYAWRIDLLKTQCFWSGKETKSIMKQMFNCPKVEEKQYMIFIYKTGYRINYAYAKTS